MFPRILAIERNDHGVIGGLRIAMRELCHLVDQMVGCIVTVPRGIGEANQIRQSVVTEERIQARARHLVRPVVGKRIYRRRRTAKTAQQYVCTARGPLEAGTIQKLERAAADGAFGRPATRRADAESTSKAP